jgi:hypothetical protein
MTQTSSMISGIVRDPDGNPVAQARVYFTGSPVALPDIAMLTNSRGAFSVSVPVAGTYQLECAADGFETTGATVIVAQGQVAQIEITLQR